MASPSDRPESPEVDFSVIRTSIDMGHKMIDQILYGIHYGSDEVRNLLREECDFILECKVCRNLFRSFPNFVAHKRVYCMEYHEEKELHNKFESHANNEEAVIIQPEAPENVNRQSKEMPGVSTVVENVINNNFKGKSKEYQLYTKVAEDVERQKVAKTTNTIVLTPLPGCASAFEVHKTKGESSTNNSPKKLSPLKCKDKAKDTVSPAKNKNSIKSVCAELVKKKLLQGPDLGNNLSSERPSRLAARSRKSSPRKSMEYMETSSSKDDDEECMEIDTEGVEDGRNEGKGVTKDIMELCDFKNMKCKVCKITFSRRGDLTYHVKLKHVNNVKAKLHKAKSSGKSEGESTSSNLSSSIAKASKTNVLKVTDNLLSCSTGWKKCDKCGKVFWKAKSYNRHYSNCKGSVTSQPSSTDKAKMRQSPMNNEAFMKLEEKLRAGVIQTIYPEDVVKNKSTETSKEKRVTKVETIYPDTANSKIDKKTVSAKGKHADVNLNADSKEVKSSLNCTVLSLEKSKALVKRPINIVNIHPDAAQTKTYNFRLGNISKDQVTKISTEHIRELTSVKSTQERLMSPEKDISKITKDVNSDSPGFKKLEERLVREAGLDEPVNVAEDMGNMPNTTVEEHAEVRTGKISSEPEKIDVPTAGLKDPKHHRESPEIKQLMEKLTREALEPKAVASDEKKGDGKADKDKVEDVVEEGRPKRTTRLSSLERKIEKGNAKTNENEGNSVTTSCSKRISSRDSNHGKESVPIRTPEKLNLDMNLSPVSSPGRGANLPSSPTPSMQSTDSYNLKFKMTVQEMAELVESASLTKFAKERKKRARTILNKKQIKEAQKVKPSLSKPMKQHVKKRHIIIRNVYGTRNKGAIQGSKTGVSPKVGTRNACRNSSNSEFTPTALKEKQDQSKKLTREQKRLMNSEGFVEENFYSVSHLMRERHSDSDTEGRRNAPERKRLSANSKDHLVKNKPSNLGPTLGCSKSPTISHRKSLEAVNKNSLITSDLNEFTSKDETSAAAEKVNDSEGEDMDKNSKKTTTSITSDERRYSLRGLDEEPVLKEKSSDVVIEEHEDDSNSGKIKSHISTRLGGKSNKDIAKQANKISTREKTAENDENQLDSRHRTRLSTGSIFFDSELLTMSPSKAEKIVNDRNRRLKVTSRGSEKPLLSFSRRAAAVSNKLKSRSQGATSEPQRYSLATGVQQCLKCKRKFWKNSTYRVHMNNSPCSNKKTAKKRALSITPDGKNGNGRSEDAVIDAKSKRPKGATDEVDTTNDVKSSDMEQQQTVDSVSCTVEAEVVSAEDNDKNVLVGQKRKNSSIESNKTVIDEVAGPSGTNLSEVDCDSDEDDSEFSGFSEDDLKTSELELSQIEIVNDEEIEGKC